MKIQCPCGSKYSIDVTPGMQSVQFVCPNCGGDYSAMVNELIQRELAERFPSSAPPAAPSPPVAVSPGLRISQPQVPADAPPGAQAGAVCAKHNEPATETCSVCQKPICPKCLDLFGYFCSPFCKSKAAVQKMDVRAYAGSSSAREQRLWRKLGWAFGLAVVLVVAGLGAWIWYAWVASVPHQYFSVKFDQLSHTGSSYVSGDQIVILHGGTLARYDMKTGKQVWSGELVSPDQINQLVQQAVTAEAAAREANGDGYAPPVPGAQREKNARLGLETRLSLYGEGQNIWVADGSNLTRYDWNSGSVLQQVPVPGAGGLVAHGNELLVFGHAADGAPSVAQVDLASGTVSTNEFQDEAMTALAQNAQGLAAVPPASPQGGLPVSPDGGSPAMDPQRIARNAQNLSLQGQAVLPAIVANSSYEQRLEGAMNDGQERRPPPPQPVYAPPAAKARQSATPRHLDFTLIPDNDSFEEFSAQLVQANFVQREAMKAAPAQSALANVTGGNETAAINEQLNEMQRNNGKDKVTEDESTYSVAIHQAGSSDPAWTGEVIGPPKFFPLKTVNVLAAGKTVIVFDKSNKKLWQTEMTYDVTGGGQSASDESPYGAGPCVEHDGALYVFDQAVLGAFDAATGNARWRIPTVGVVGLFFDAKGMLYVNTTTGNPDDIRYSREIDVTKSTEAVVLKIDPATGKILWTTKNGGFISYLSGPFIYTVQVSDPGDEDELATAGLTGVFKSPLTRIIRISPSDGHSIWQEDEDRAAMNVQFDGSFIRIIFKKDVEVLHFLAL